MARKSTIDYARRVLSPAQFKAWQRMPVKLSKSELAAGKRPGGKRARPKSLKPSAAVGGRRSNPKTTREAAILFVKHATGRNVKKGENPWTVARDYARDQGRTEKQARAWASRVVKGLTSNPAKKSRKGRRAANRRRMRAGMSVSWTGPRGGKRQGVVHTARAKSSTVIDGTSMRFEEHLNRDLYPYRANPGRRRLSAQEQRAVCRHFVGCK